MTSTGLTAGDPGPLATAPSVGPIESADSNRPIPHIAVCICTFKRPALLKTLLDSLASQETADRFTYSIVVADNDREQSARAVVTDFAARSDIPVTYCAEPEQNIALARNRALAHAEGNFIAFIDDDEFPSPTWLQTALNACLTHEVSGVLGPVRPHFEVNPPKWVTRGRFCERPEHPTGTQMRWQACRTGNVLFRRNVIRDLPQPFDPQFGTGGEDKDFFMRMMDRGCRFIWCNEAVVYEVVPPHRITRKYMLQRALLRGRNVLKHPKGRAALILTSCVATPSYALILPFAWLAGHHWFMHYCIRLCDHAGRLLTLAGLNPVKERVN